MNAAAQSEKHMMEMCKRLGVTPMDVQLVTGDDKLCVMVKGWTVARFEIIPPEEQKNGQVLNRT